MTNNKKLRVAHFPQIPCKGFYVDVKDVLEAKKVMDILADYDSFQFENHIKPDYCNSQVLEEFNEEEQEWVLWMDDETCIDDVDEYLEYLEEQGE